MFTKLKKYTKLYSHPHERGHGFSASLMYEMSTTPCFKTNNIFNEICDSKLTWFSQTAIKIHLN